VAFRISPLDPLIGTQIHEITTNIKIYSIESTTTKALQPQETTQHFIHCPVYVVVPSPHDTVDPLHAAEQAAT
jgi:hypothetical protein